MKSLKILGSITFLALAVASCTTFKSSGLAMYATPPQGTVLGEFHTTVWVNEFLGSAGGVKLLNISANATDNAVTDAIAREIRAKNGTEAINVDIKYKASILNLILNGLTLGLWAPGTVEISGIVVR